MPTLVTPRFSRFSLHFNSAITSPKSPKPEDRYFNPNASTVDLPLKSPHARSFPQAITTSSLTSVPRGIDSATRRAFSTTTSPTVAPPPATALTHGTATIDKGPSSELYAVEYGSSLAPSPNPEKSWEHTQSSSVYNRNKSLLRYVSLAVTILLFAIAATITGLQADVYLRYQRTNLPKAWPLRLWPQNLNLLPTLLLLTLSVVVAFLSLISLLVICVPSQAAKLIRGFTFSITTGVSFVLSLAASIYTIVATPGSLFSNFVQHASTTTGAAGTAGLSMSNPGQTKPDTIYSFTCSLVHHAKAYNADALALQLPSMSSSSLQKLIPDRFGTLCRVNEASLALLISLCGVSFAGLIVVVLGLINQRKMNGSKNEPTRLRKGSKSSDGSAEKVIV